VVIGDQNVVAVTNVERDRILALARFLLGLRSKKFPMGDMIEHKFRADMVLARHLIDMARRVAVGDQHPSLRIGIGAPEIGEGAAAATHP
jgi:hypothetical protein